MTYQCNSIIEANLVGRTINLAGGAGSVTGRILAVYLAGYPIARLQCLRDAVDRLIEVIRHEDEPRRFETKDESE